MFRDVTLKQVEAFLIAGYYGFLDYAITSWSLHLGDACHQKDFGESFNNLAEDLEAFLDCHWTHSDLLDINVTKTVQETLSLFKESEFYDRLRLYAQP